MRRLVAAALLALALALPAPPLAAQALPAPESQDEPRIPVKRRQIPEGHQ